MLNERLFKSKLVLKGITQEYVAKALKIDPATLYKKKKGISEFTVCEMYKMKKLLDLSWGEVESIFLLSDLRKCKNKEA